MSADKDPAYIAQAAELTRLRAMLTPPDDVPCYTVDALKYNDGIDLPGDMPMVPADLVNRLRAKVAAADRLAWAAKRISRTMAAMLRAGDVIRNLSALGKSSLEGEVNDVCAALSAYEEAAK